MDRKASKSLVAQGNACGLLALVPKPLWLAKGVRGRAQDLFALAPMPVWALCGCFARLEG